MASNLDKYLDKLPEKDRQTLANVNAKETTNIESPTPTPGNQVDTNQPKLDGKTAEHIQNVNDGQGNNYQTKKDGLQKYPTSQGNEPKGQTPEKQPEL